VGRYKVTYSVANKYNAKAVSTKSIYVYCQSTVPALTGMSYTEAVAAAKTAGFTVTKVEEYSATVASGIVISQDVTAGTKSYKTITLTVSKGTDPAGTGA
ncbi:MAG: PASTA domain-containing protein, partial [Clostridiales bacterium]|nr:PASTA domain-containing protein [Clostridiales bacterium]